MTKYLTAVSPPRSTKASILIHLKVTDKGPETDVGCQVGFGSLASQSCTELMFDCSPHFLRLIKYLTQNEKENVSLKSFCEFQGKFIIFYLSLLILRFQAQNCWENWF